VRGIATLRKKPRKPGRTSSKHGSHLTNIRRNTDCLELLCNGRGARDFKRHDAARERTSWAKIRNPNYSYCEGRRELF